MTQYEKMLEWLFGRFPSYQKIGARAYKPGLFTMEALDEFLGHPHRQYPSVHIAGTNGKGSTSHMIAAGLAATGLRTGLYTSPHLLNFRERIKLVQNGSFKMISEDDVMKFISDCKPFFDKYDPSFFEITTAMALKWFAAEKVDIAVIETGLGGRLDSTNVITPVLSVITNIGLEHCEHLGFTLEEVAFEKAGIIKPGVPVVIGETTVQTRPVFEKKASECGSRVIFARETSPFLEIDTDILDLKGDYQSRNLRTVSAAASILGVDKSAFARGVAGAAAATGLRGRWETLRKAGSGHAEIICDTGHNAHGLKWVAEQLDRISCDYENVFFVFGLVRDKDVDAIAGILPRNLNYIFTQASADRALPAVDLANVMYDHGLSGRMSPTVSQALDMADSMAGEKDLIFIGGSNFIVAEILGQF